MPKDFSGAPYLTKEETAAWPTDDIRCASDDFFTPLKNRIQRHGLDGPSQMAGQHFAMGCVALEITQRCNLDCSACYLSDMSEAVGDLPLAEIFRRIDMIAAHYGPRTNVQITGGDPTLRKRGDLVAIVKRIAGHKMRSALFTNGIKANRDLLRDLAVAGLNDVAFHVDMTQERKGYDSEEALNAIRDDYIARARNLGLLILFNTTIFEGNFRDVSMLAKFFRDRARDIHLASFQMIADTGRGTARERSVAITQHSVMKGLCEGAEVNISFDTAMVGHPSCNRYGMVLTAGHETTSVFSNKDKEFFDALFVAGRDVFADRHNLTGSIARLSRAAARHPILIIRALGYAVRKLWDLRAGVLSAGGRVDRLTFYIHNFMHADQLEQDRCETCVFMTMTRDGPVSMCVHNAKRDSYILQPVHDDKGRVWAPLGGDAPKRDVIDIYALPLKRLKGRARAARLEERLRA